MPDWLKAVLVMVVLLVVFWLLAVKPTADKVNMTTGRVDAIHEYLGNNQGNNPATWKGLTGIIKQNNEDLRKALFAIRQDICTLKPTDPNCPPSPAGSPVAPPSYPP